MYEKPTIYIETNAQVARVGVQGSWVRAHGQGWQLGLQGQSSGAGCRGQKAKAKAETKAKGQGPATTKNQVRPRSKNKPSAGALKIRRALAIRRERYWVQFCSFEV